MNLFCLWKQDAAEVRVLFMVVICFVAYGGFITVQNWAFLMFFLSEGRLWRWILDLSSPKEESRHSWQHFWSTSVQDIFPPFLTDISEIIVTISKKKYFTWDFFLYLSKTHFIKPIPANSYLFFHVIHKYPSAVWWSLNWPSILFFSQMFYVPFQHNFPELVSVCKPLEFFINIHVCEKLC